MNRRRFGQMMGGAAAVAATPGWTLPPAAKGVRFSFMIWALAKTLGFDGAMEAIAAAGYQGVELTGQFHKWDKAETARVMKKMRALGLVFDSTTGVSSNFSTPGEEQTFLTQLAQLLEDAKRLECPQVIVMSGKAIDSLGPEAQRKLSVENLKRAMEMAEKQGIEVLLEPIDYLERPGIYLASVSEGFEIVDGVGSPRLKVLYDIYHEQRSFGNLIEKLEKNIDKVGLIHVADVPGRNEPGTGEIDYPVIYRKLAELKYERWIAMEFYPTTEPVGSLKKARLEAEAGLGIHSTV